MAWGAAGADTATNPATGNDVQEATATYNIDPPENGWRSAPGNPIYTARLRANEVRDTAGNHARPVHLESFGVRPDPEPEDNTPPTAEVSATVGNVVQAGGDSLSVTVIYRDNVALDLDSINQNHDAIEVTSSQGGPAATRHLDRDEPCLG